MGRAKVNQQKLVKHARTSDSKELCIGMTEQKEENTTRSWKR